MKAQDWQDAENYRNRIIAELMEYCMEHGLDSSATEKQMVIKLPTVNEINVWPEVEKTKRFNHQAWGNIDVFGNVVGSDTDLPGELPPPNYTLDEGEAPKGDDEK